MFTIRFLGQVHPTFAEISLSNPVVINWPVPEQDLKMAFEYSITKSQINLSCRLNRWDQDILSLVYKHALDLCRASVNAVAFSMGWGVTVQLHTFVDPFGISSAVFLRDERLRPLCTAYDLTTNFDEIHQMLLVEPTLFLAFNDLIEAITVPHESLVNCARAIERLKHLIAPPDSKDKAAWAALRLALRIDESYLKHITDTSANPRHGNPEYVSGDITTEVTFRAWAVMNRYLEYRKAGRQLPGSFPMLGGKLNKQEPT